MEASQQLRDIISISIPDFDCEEGWRSIIESAILCIDRYYKRRAAVEEHRMADNDSVIAKIHPSQGLEIVQIKEKFGGLRIYCNYHDDYINGIIALAETMAYRTCEVTGGNGSLHKKGGWFKTVSPDFASAHGYEPAQHNHRRAVNSDVQI